MLMMGPTERVVYGVRRCVRGRAVFALLVLVVMASALLAASGCSEAQARRALDAQEQVYTGLADSAERTRGSLALLRTRAEAVASGTITVREALGPTLALLPPGVRSDIERLADSGLDGAALLIAVSDRLSAAAIELSERASEAAAQTAELRERVELAETDDERLLQTLEGMVWIGLSVLGVPGAGALAVAMRRRGQAEGAAEVAGAFSRGRLAAAGGGNAIDLADPETRLRISEGLSDRTKRGLAKKNIALTETAGAAPGGA